MISSIPSSIFRSLGDISLTASIALPFGNKNIAGSCHFGSFSVRACHTSTSFFQGQQLSSSSGLKIEGDLTLLIFRKVNKTQLFVTANITVNQFRGSRLKNKTKQLNKRRSKVTPINMFLYCLLILYCGCCCQLLLPNC